MTCPLPHRLGADGASWVRLDRSLPLGAAWGPTSPLSASPSGSHVDWEGGRESTVTAEPSPRRPTGPAAGCVGVCSVGVPSLPGAGHPAVLLSAALVGGDGPAGAPSQ